MARDLLIRRLRDFARRHAWDGVAVTLFAAGLVLGAGRMAQGAENFVGFLVPGTAAQASDEPARAGEGVAQLPMFDFAGGSHYKPAVLYPVASHLFPDWLRGALGKTVRPDSMAGLNRRKLNPAIAICIDDLGEDLAGTDRAMALPKDVALSFLPFAEATPFLAQEAGGKGHTVLAHVPMEALSPIDPGPMTLKVRAGDIAEKLSWNIARVPGLVGINNHEGSRFTEDEVSLTPVMQSLAARHLFFFDSRTVGDSKAESVARHFGLMSAGRDIFLDDVATEEAVKAQLAALVAEARRSGTAIAIGHPHDVTLNVLEAWLKDNHGVELISLPEAMRRKNEGEERTLAKR